MDAKLKKLLGEIDAMLSNGRTTKSSERAEDLWSVLTALRGPDDDDQNVKRTTTEVIRRVAFPKAAKLYVEGTDLIGASFDTEGTAFSVGTGTHFTMHAEKAARVLGLLKE